MKSIEFPEQTAEIAKDQEQYTTLPSWVGPIQIGPNEKDVATGVVCCMELDEGEIKRIVKYKKIWCRFLTFGNPLQPFNLFAVENYFKFSEQIPNTPVITGHQEIELKLGFWERLKFLFSGKSKIWVRYDYKALIPKDSGVKLKQG